MTPEALAAGISVVAITAAVAGLAGWRARPPRRELDVPDAFLGLAVLVWSSVVATSVLGGVSTGSWAQAETPPLLVAVAGTALGGAVAAAWSLLRAGRAALGLTRWAPGWCAIGLALAPVALGVGALWMVLLEMLGIPVEPQDLLGLAGAGPEGAAAWLARLYGAVGAPMVEEVVFRGLVLGALSPRLGQAGAVVASGVLFGLLHLSEPAAVGPLVVLGMALGWLRVRSGALAPAVALHLGNNGAALGMALLGLVAT